MSDIFTVLLGLLHGNVIIPLTLYLGLLVRRDLSQRYIKLPTITNFVAPLAMMVLWLTMSYLAADSILDILASVEDARLRAGKMWILGTFLGLTTLALTLITLNKMKYLKKKY